jgi:hypothetical protein
MQKKSKTKIEQEIIKKAEARAKKKRSMPVSGKGVFRLQGLINRSQSKKNKSK